MEMLLKFSRKYAFSLPPSRCRCGTGAESMLNSQPADAGPCHGHQQHALSGPHVPAAGFPQRSSSIGISLPWSAAEASGRGDWPRDAGPLEPGTAARPANPAFPDRQGEALGPPICSPRAGPRADAGADRLKWSKKAEPASPQAGKSHSTQARRQGKRQRGQRQRTRTRRSRTQPAGHEQQAGGEQAGKGQATVELTARARGIAVSRAPFGHLAAGRGSQVALAPGFSP